MSTTLPTQRLRDWPERLAALFAASAARPFEWGRFDCCLFAADAVQAVTGHDPAADLRGRYRSKLGAARVLGRFGGVAGVAAARAGLEVPPAMAQPGDVGLSHHQPGQPALAVWGGSAWHAVGAGAGLVVVPASAVVRAWRCTAEPAAQE